MIVGSRRVGLVIVATPIGNLGDLSPRAARELAEADLIACEDTRRTGKLLHLAGIARRPLLRIDDHTEAERVEQILDRLGRGQRVVLVSDAGTPAVSDPGERLVRAVVAGGYPVEVVPGPSAAIAALVGSGLGTQRFCFEGFLPRRPGERGTRLAQLAGEERTLIVYESPHRLAVTLTDMVSAFGADRAVVVARELTKLHEQWWRGRLDEAAAWAAATVLKGEVVIVVEGASPPALASTAELEAAVAQALTAGASVKDVALELAARFGVSRRRIYELAVRAAPRGLGDTGS